MMASPSGTQDRVRTAWKVFVTPNAILDTDLTIYEKMAYITIARHANSDGTGAYPSYSTIAKEGSMGRTSAIVAVKGLVEKGYLIKESRRAVEGDRTSNLYTLLDVPESKQHEPEVVRHTHHRSVQGELGVVHVTHHRGTPDAPELNPLTKPSEQTPLTYTAETQPPVCVMAEIDLKIAELQQKTKDALGVMLEQKELIKWLQTYDETYILTKVKIIQEQGSGSNNPVRSLRAAIKQDWQQAPPIASDTTKSFAKKGCNHTADETDRVVPAAQPGKYERFYQVYQKKTDKLDTTR